MLGKRMRKALLYCKSKGMIRKYIQIYAKMFTEELFTTVKNWKPPNIQQ